MDCERLYQFYERRYPDGELTRVAVWRRERDYNSRVCRVETAAGSVAVDEVCGKVEDTQAALPAVEKHHGGKAAARSGWVGLKHILFIIRNTGERHETETA